MTKLELHKAITEFFTGCPAFDSVHEFKTNADELLDMTLHIDQLFGCSLSGHIIDGFRLCIKNYRSRSTRRESINSIYHSIFDCSIAVVPLYGIEGENDEYPDDRHFHDAWLEYTGNPTAALDRFILDCILAPMHYACMKEEVLSKLNHLPNCMAQLSEDKPYWEIICKVDDGYLGALRFSAFGINKGGFLYSADFQPFFENDEGKLVDYKDVFVWTEDRAEINVDNMVKWWRKLIDEHENAQFGL